MDAPIRYKKLQERFGLPKFGELKDTFRFEINGDNEVFDQIRVEISDRLFSFSDRIIEPIIAGSESYCCLYEQAMLTEAERQELFDIYKKIQDLKWQNNLLMIKPDEKATAEWIRRTWALWNTEMSDALSRMCKKLSYGWKTIKIKDEKAHYHG